MADFDNFDGVETQDELEIIKHHVNFEPPSPRPGQEWLSYPELPTSRDLNPDWDDPQQFAEICHLLPNTWEVPWKSKNTYLETHYRLQREEAITMLRHSIDKFKKDLSMKDDQETCIYTKVFVRGYLMTRLGPMCQVQFSAKRSGKKIRWAQSHRLTVGTLVAISTAKDCFSTICMPAIISDRRIRDGLDQNPPTVHFQWANLDDAVIDPDEELVMIETRFGYFEAVRHSMVGLQHVANTDTPLDKYLVQADKCDLTAQYVEEDPEMDIRSLVHHVPDASSMTAAQVEEARAKVRESVKSYSIVDGFDNQLSRYTNLDNSQLSAVHRILTKELAIVQGPPGTGKTFTSVQALQILLESQKRGSNVIIVAAQTNHAVDQILLQLIRLGFKAVRLGGRTQNEEIKRYSMYNLRRRIGASWNQRADRDFKTFESARKKNVTTLEQAIDDIFPGDLINPEILKSMGIISQSQLESLRDDLDWIDASSLTDQTELSLTEWLGDQIIQAVRKEEKDPDFEATEEDEESLYLDGEENDVDLDDCIVDEDEAGGRVDGKFLPIGHILTGANPQNHTEGDAIIDYELQKSNLWDIEPKYRGAVYQYWQRQLLSSYRKSVCHILADNTRIAKNLKVNRWYKDTKCIKSQRVEIIGCTTTGLCKYRGLLAALQPRTMLIEEAAETREANILSALYGSLQQLILVGDHQQLAPHCDTPDLAKAPYYMRVSMFERLVHLKMPFTFLNMQRRMIPELRELLNPFYPSLQDHPVVIKKDSRPPIPGMQFPSFFFHHHWTDSLDENMSRYNILEAEMIVQFINYLLQNGVPASQITVLTFYRGQKKKIQAQIKSKLKQWAPFTNVFTVDSYQGEENDIVILSLVRSQGKDGPHRAGFLQDPNRGVVSISRARCGFYIFGNMDNLLYASDESYEMWGPVQEVFLRQGRFGGDQRLPISCQNHGKTTWMSHPEEWINCHGGCDQKCPETLSCRHACKLQCHWISHDRLICREPCERPIPCGHRCQQVCGEKCECNCPDFRGAYPHDEFQDEETALGSDEITLNYDQNRVAPFVDRTRYRGDSAMSSRGGRRGSGRLPRNYRPGFGYGDGVTREPTQSSTGSNFVYSGNGLSYAWATFNARLDDAQKLMDAQAQAAPMKSPGQVRSRTALEIQDTFRPVTLDHGMRNIGQSSTSKAVSPPKEDDNLNLADKTDIGKVALATRSLAISHDSVGTRGPEDATRNAGYSFVSHTLTEHGRGVPGHSGSLRLNETTTATSSLDAGLHTTASSLISQPRSPIAAYDHAPEARPANGPEWELASTVSGTYAMNEDDEVRKADKVNIKADNDKGQDDLMSFE
ncbi:P-loop containing nucleoside triphosphate hydrolase protein [Hypoxylon trugodes]|uniref:P-loop containing nucleoside triphosphate hydrolase protein n=1 Tax=Hypoxylon trugodes TaxID=326681 RepID=UPI00218D0875|nr:P-loop containing nucleoside triphosphate hydrolase protein [Hypoxylon trugodes]KAI1391754.1 P-loop containing nucleoside triphosphate hydrolase protein [Hypoxylon trugodes]